MFEFAFVCRQFLFAFNLSVALTTGGQRANSMKHLLNESVDVCKFWFFFATSGVDARGLIVLGRGRKECWCGWRVNLRLRMIVAPEFLVECS